MEARDHSNGDSINKMSDYSKIELFISGRQLKDKDVFSKSDPFVKITLCDNGHWVNVGRTETI